MLGRKLKRHFVSDIDKKLTRFNRTHKNSATEQAEVDKYQLVHQLRDDELLKNKRVEDALWD